MLNGLTDVQGQITLELTLRDGSLPKCGALAHTAPYKATRYDDNVALKSYSIMVVYGLACVEMGLDIQR